MDYELHPHEARILKGLREKSSPEEVSKATELPLDAVMRAGSWLSTKNLVTIEEKITEEITLDKEGVLYSEKGLPERRLVDSAAKNPSMAELRKILPGAEMNIALGWINKKSMAKIDGEQIRVLDAKETSDEKLLKLLKEKKTLYSDELDAEMKQGLELLKKRKNVVKAVERRRIWLLPTAEGMELGKTDISETVSQLTPEMLVSGEWKNKRFRPYDVDIYVKPEHPAKRHPLQRLTSEIKDIFISMGFSEISGPLVESSFWNFDALFVPQDHPAREMQDTFYLKNPAKVEIPRFAEYKGKVAKTHEDGNDTGSLGWGYRWNEQASRKPLLRTHTTAVTCKYLTTLKKEDLPANVFCIGKVFRNEAIDYKHLPEFFQVEGIVVDENANFRNLLGILDTFYKKMGFKDVRFRPSYYPYTEMSVDPEIYLEGKGWMELGGAGIFRPEVVKPLLGFDCPVLAWGLGLDRVVALRLGLKDIRDLYISDVEALREARIL